MDSSNKIFKIIKVVKSSDFSDEITLLLNCFVFGLDSLTFDNRILKSIDSNNLNCGISDKKLETLVNSFKNDYIGFKNQNGELNRQRLENSFGQLNFVLNDYLEKYNNSISFDKKM